MTRRREHPAFRWEGVEVRPYKATGEEATFRALSREVLFDDPALACQVRYFEVEPGGHSTLERHEHVHAVIVLRGHGQCLVGSQVLDLQPHDLVSVASWQWHQFRAAADDHLGFLCLVNHQRDRPQLPTAGDLESLSVDPTVAAFLGSRE